MTKKNKKPVAKKAVKKTKKAAGKKAVAMCVTAGELTKLRIAVAKMRKGGKAAKNAAKKVRALVKNC